MENKTKKQMIRDIEFEITFLEEEIKKQALMELQIKNRKNNISNYLYDIETMNYAEEEIKKWNSQFKEDWQV